MQTATTIRLPKLHSAQRQIKREMRRHNVIDCGRRFGKNILLQDIASNDVIAGKPVGWGAPIYRQTMDDWRALENILAPIIERKSISEMRMEIVTGGIIEFWSMDKPDSIRGKKYARFIVNEAGLVPDLMDTYNYIIAPTLADLQGGMILAGTPKGQNAFWRFYNLNNPDWNRWKMPSYSNPHIPTKELDGLRATMTERAFAQEILAEFLDDGGGVFRFVREAATATAIDAGIPGHQYVIGVDWGRSNDATCFVVLDSGTKEMVYLDRMTDTDYASQRLRLKALSDRFNRAYIVAETNSMGQPNIEAMQSMGAPITGFTTSNSTKAQAVQALELAFEQRTLAILDNEILVSELMAFESEKLPSGLVRYSAPEGMHDDSVMALAIAHSAIGASTWMW